MADEPTEALAPASEPAPDSAPPAADPVQAAPTTGKTAKAPDAPPVAAGDGKADVIAAIIRRELANSEISRSQQAWECLETRLPQIVAALIKEA